MKTSTRALQRKGVWLGILFVAFALLAAACSQDTEDETPETVERGRLADYPGEQAAAVGLLTDADRQRQQPDGRTVELPAQGGEDRPVDLVETPVVDAEQRQRRDECSL